MTVYRVSGHLPKPHKERWIRLRDDPGAAALSSAPAQEAIVTALRRRTRLATGDPGGFVFEADILGQSGSNRASLTALIRKGIVEEVERIQGLHVPVPDRSQDRIPELTPAQSVAWNAIARALQAQDSTPFLLYGVTGSGKTELYLRAAAWCIRHGKSALVLAPEIALSSQVADRFASASARWRCSTPVFRWGTLRRLAGNRRRALSGGGRTSLRSLRACLVRGIDRPRRGARPGLQSSSVPRYHARSTAEHLAQSMGAVLVLGSATPSVETFWRSQQGDIRLLALPERVGPELLATDGSRESTALELPRVDVVDMRLELHRGNTSLLSVRRQELLAGSCGGTGRPFCSSTGAAWRPFVLCRALRHGAAMSILRYSTRLSPGSGAARLSSLRLP